MSFPFGAINAPRTISRAISDCSLVFALRFCLSPMKIILCHIIAADKHRNGITHILVTEIIIILQFLSAEHIRDEISRFYRSEAGIIAQNSSAFERGEVKDRLSDSERCREIVTKWETFKWSHLSIKMNVLGTNCFFSPTMAMLMTTHTLFFFRPFGALKCQRFYNKRNAGDGDQILSHLITRHRGDMSMFYCFM